MTPLPTAEPTWVGVDATTGQMFQVTVAADGGRLIATRPDPWSTWSAPEYAAPVPLSAVVA